MCAPQSFIWERIAKSQLCFEHPALLGRSTACRGNKGEKTQGWEGGCLRTKSPNPSAVWCLPQCRSSAFAFTYCWHFPPSAGASIRACSDLARVRWETVLEETFLPVTSTRQIARRRTKWKEMERKKKGPPYTSAGAGELLEPASSSLL